MNNKIEDLKNTWVSTSNCELVGLYIKKALSLGCEINSDADSTTEKGYSCVYMMGSGVMIGAGSYPLGNSNYKELTLSDLKPRTKTEFVKCEFECAWHAIKAFEDGEDLYTKLSHKDFVLIDNAPDVLRFLYNLHRKVETEIDERQEFIDTALSNVKLKHLIVVKEAIGDMYDSGKFKLVE